MSESCGEVTWIICHVADVILLRRRDVRGRWGRFILCTTMYPTQHQLIFCFSHWNSGGMTMYNKVDLVLTFELLNQLYPFALHYAFLPGVRSCARRAYRVLFGVGVS